MPFDPSFPGWFLLSFLIGILLWGGLLVVVILVAIWMARRIGLTASEAAHRDALRELDLRYARGELERDAYLRMRDDLRGGP